MSVKLEFVRGHCGWDVVTLLPDGQVPASDELACSVKILGAPMDGGLEVGWLGRGAHDDEITLRMVNSTTKNWIPMCGGMTQVIGKALIETFLQKHFNIDVSQPVLNLKLMTPSGAIPVRIDRRDGQAANVTTTMDNYLSYLYQRGIEPLVLEGIPLLRVGTYAVVDVLALERRHPGVEFTRRDPGLHLDIVNRVLRAFREYVGLSGVNAMLYDDRPEGLGQYRVFPRFYSDDLAAARMPWEFQCGTGSIAVAMALAHAQRWPFTCGEGTVVLEWGSYRSTRDPYGIRTSTLQFDLDGTRVATASFSHSVIEILVEGHLILPGY